MRIVLSPTFEPNKLNTALGKSYTLQVLASFLVFCLRRMDSLEPKLNNLAGTQLEYLSIGQNNFDAVVSRVPIFVDRAIPTVKDYAQKESSTREVSVGTFYSVPQSLSLCS